MKATLSLICILIFTSTLLSVGQDTFNQKYGSETDYKRLYYLNIQYIQSWVKSDTATFNNLLWADDFVHQSGSNGALYPKKQIMQEFGKPRFNSIAYFFADKIKIQFISNDAALVFSSPPYRGIDDKDESLSQYNDVYIRRNGAWVCVSANIAGIPKVGDKPFIFTKIPANVPLISFYKGSETDIKKLMELNSQHAEAFMKAKPEILDKILTDDFILLSSNGQLYEKQEVLTKLKSASNSNLASYSLENLQIRFVAKDIAMVHAVMIENMKDGSKTATQYNDIYLKRGDNWVCVSGNNTPISN